MIVTRYLDPSKVIVSRRSTWTGLWSGPYSASVWSLSPSDRSARSSRISSKVRSSARLFSSYVIGVAPLLYPRVVLPTHK